jgi:hypothetical protein
MRLWHAQLFFLYCQDISVVPAAMGCPVRMLTLAACSSYDNSPQFSGWLEGERNGDEGKTHGGCF